MKNRATLFGSSLIAAISLCLALWGCAVPQKLIPITDSQQRLEFQRFSILPPQGPDWFNDMGSLPAGLEYRSAKIWFVKIPSTASKTHTIFAMARSGSVEEKVENREEYLRKLGKIMFVSTERNQLVNSKTSLDQSLKTDCLRYDLEFEDRGVPGHEGSPFLMDTHGYLCLHPNLPNYVVEVSYSQRRLPSEPPIRLESEAEPYLHSLVFK